MRYFLLKSLSLLLISPLSFASSITSDFQAIAKQDLALLSQTENPIIHETDTHYITASPLTNFESYDYYYIQRPRFISAQGLEIPSQRVVFEHNDFFIVEVRNQKQLNHIAHVAHHEGGFCGMLQKLSPTAIALNKTNPPIKARSKSSEVVQATEAVSIDNILNTMEVMASWGTRYESHSQGVQTGESLKAIYESLIPDDRDDVSLELIKHRGSQQKSIVIRILGQKTPEKIVILGSHIDSINSSDKDDAPGVDDNASGTAVNMEAFHILMQNQFRPQSTIEIHGYAAEEIGLVGSKEMAEDYKKQNKKVISMVQMDMNAFAKNGQAKITFISNKTNRSLTSQLMDLSKWYNDIPATTGFLLFGSSDHASWNSQGYPVAFPTEDPFNFNRKIHTKDDTMASINSPKQTEEFAKLAVAYLMHFSN